MKEVTLCTWIEISDYGTYATVLSYATQSNHNEWLFAFVSSSIYHFIRNVVIDFNDQSMIEVQKVKNLKQVRKKERMILKAWALFFFFFRHTIALCVSAGKVRMWLDGYTFASACAWQALLCISASLLLTSQRNLFTIKHKLNSWPMISSLFCMSVSSKIAASPSLILKANEHRLTLFEVQSKKSLQNPYRVVKN